MTTDHEKIGKSESPKLGGSSRMHVDKGNRERALRAWLAQQQR